MMISSESFLRVVNSKAQHFGGQVRTASYLGVNATDPSTASEDSQGRQATG